MVLLSGFCGDNHSFDYTPTNIENLNYLKVRNGAYDEVFMSKTADIEYKEESKNWDYDTLFYALFQNNLFAGNVSFTADIVSAMRIKRRKSSEYNWDTLFEIPIRTNKDFAFERFDKYVRGNTDYEYSLVPIINSIEGNLSTSSITANFEGFFFIEKDTIICAMLNTELSHQRNNNGTTITTLGRQYPFNIKNGNANYTSGSLKATFIDMIGCDFDIKNGWNFREKVDNFLTNGKPKIFKNAEGKMWMVSIIDSIPQDFSHHWQMPIHTINWAEIGNAENVDDMYDNGFIDIDSRLI
ncbi:hypothetical protein [Anaerocolumna xylanovorans]|uniref:Uncharacterized protein n=1 Tax=Anaerocolumna xylanovorans DSM 12503 TaxID=1121345 RepID=A0A1M7YM55_9FIRM|nr:hypothetical protein [Anaerocolumna xylanovorans]SHO53701.1 hypothetical protein SAMN02745217_04245 [Anaerocolumna xylanovorans DSM 12503]